MAEAPMDAEAQALEEVSKLQSLCLTIVLSIVLKTKALLATSASQRAIATTSSSLCPLQNIRL